MSKAKLRPYNYAFVYSMKLMAAPAYKLGSILLDPPWPKVAGVEKGIKYVPNGHHLQSLDIYKPLGEPPFPVLIYIHGGAQHVGDKGLYNHICRIYAGAGYLVFNANYRMAPRWKFKAQWQDAASAVKWVYDNAKHYGGDNSRLFLGGDSAGATLCSAYAVMAQDEELRKEVGAAECLPTEALRGMLLFYGVYDCETVQETKFPFTKGVMSGYLGRDPQVVKECLETASPLRHVRPGFPPCFVTTSEMDPLHSETLALVPVLEKNGVDYEYINLARNEYPYTSHGFLNIWFSKGARVTIPKSISFLKRHS